MVGNPNESTVTGTWERSCTHQPEEEEGPEQGPRRKIRTNGGGVWRKAGEGPARLQEAEDHVLEQVDALKGSAEETNNEVEARFVRLEDMIQALGESIERMREDATLCKRDAVSGGTNITISTLAPSRKGSTGQGTPRKKHANIERGACRLDTWDEFKKELKKHFYPENVVYEARKKLRELKQRGIMWDYVKEFTTLILQIPNMSEDDLLFYFIDGLQGWAKQEIHRRDVRMVDEAIAIAIAESVVDFQLNSHTNATKNKDKYPAKGSHPMSSCPKLGSLSAIVDRQDTESQAEMGSLQVLNALKAKLLTPHRVMGSCMEAVINEKLTRAMVIDIPMPSFSSVCILENGSPCMVPTVEAPKEKVEMPTNLGHITCLRGEQGRDATELPNKLPPRREATQGANRYGKDSTFKGTVWRTDTLQKKHDGSLLMCVDYRALNKGYSARASPLTDLLKKGRHGMVRTMSDLPTVLGPVHGGVFGRYRGLFGTSITIDGPTQEGKTWEWSEQCQKAFKDLKAAVSQEPILALPDFTMPFEMHTDASDFAIGGVLMQEGHPIVFESRKLNDTERRYTVLEKEITTIIHCLRPGKGNIVADALSRKAKLAAISLAKGTVLERIKESLEQDPMTRELVKLASDGKTQRFWCHNTKWAGHPGQKRTMALLETTYFWPHMKDSVELYVKTCLVFQQDKVENRQPAGLLEPLPVPKDLGIRSLWISLVHYPSLRDTKRLRERSSERVKHWGLPRSIISDRDPRFTRRLSTELFKLLSTELNFSTSFHPQTDGQTERVNTLLEWQVPEPPRWLSHGRRTPTSPRMLEKARKKMKWVNEKRRHREFVGDLVLVKLLPQQFKALRSVHKGLIQRYEGPFQVLAKVGKVSYRLDLPSTLKIHPVFHVSMLQPYHTDKEDPSRGYSHREPPVVTKSFDKESEVTWELDEDMWQFETSQSVRGDEDNAEIGGGGCHELRLFLHTLGYFGYVRPHLVLEEIMENSIESLPTVGSSQSPPSIEEVGCYK
ncbi:hypothetical protein F3Y22_tig00111298pilonHSYRG00053 [Hibiscus syriacus]|uniref:Integrase catalytic domain-containing protein n=1 Tax=Hibiscus syriacus TaxID=106335 RepID=A0A6A2YRI2_HIBSY|nr:hypothetical protein F3Y22_tig00111298pilonHSYRG00053 [Hibiscus syriacus]